MGETGQIVVDASEDEGLLEINLLPQLARLVKRFTDEGGILPDDPKAVVTALAVYGDKIEGLDQRHLDALVALGVVKKVLVGNQAHLVWQDRQSSPKQSISVEPTDVGESNETGKGEIFRLDIALDVEHERLLLYRVLLVLEVIAAFLLVRHMILWFFQL